KFINAGISEFYNGINKFYGFLHNQKIETKNKYANTEFERILMDMDFPYDSNFIGCSLIRKEEVPSILGIASHFKFMFDKENISEEFLRTTAEFSFINYYLSQTRYQWRPSTCAGPQYGYWKVHRDVLKEFLQ